MLACPRTCGIGDSETRDLPTPQVVESRLRSGMNAWLCRVRAGLPYSVSQKAGHPCRCDSHVIINDPPSLYVPARSSSLQVLTGRPSIERKLTL
jgi:hypothetical protein